MKCDDVMQPNVAPLFTVTRWSPTCTGSKVDAHEVYHEVGGGAGHYLPEINMGHSYCSRGFS